MSHLPFSALIDDAPVFQPDEAMAWMGALSDPSRLRLLRVLEGQELSVAELCEVLRLPQSTVSRHLKLLSDQAWIQSQRIGTTNRYCLVLDELHEGARNLWRWAREPLATWPTAHQDDSRLAHVLAARSDNHREIFAGLAGEWATLREQLYGNRYLVDLLAAMLPSTWTIADLGCGNADLAMRLAHHVAHVIGVDQSPQMLAAAQASFAQDDTIAQRIDLRQADLTMLPIQAATCDAALMSLVLTYVDDVPACLREAQRIVKPGGRVVVLDLLEHNREDFRRQMGQRGMGFTPQALTQRLEQAGLTRITVRVLPPQPDTTGPTLLLASGEKSDPGS